MVEDVTPHLSHVRLEVYLQLEQAWKHLYRCLPEVPNLSLCNSLSVCTDHELPCAVASLTCVLGSCLWVPQQAGQLHGLTHVEQAAMWPHCLYVLCIEVSSVYFLCLLLMHHNLNISTKSSDLQRQDFKFTLSRNQVQGVLSAGLLPYFQSLIMLFEGIIDPWIWALLSSESSSNKHSTCHCLQINNSVSFTSCREVGLCPIELACILLHSRNQSCACKQPPNK